MPILDNNSRISEIDSREPETKTGSLETELRVHRILADEKFKFCEFPEVLKDSQDFRVAARK